MVNWNDNQAYLYNMVAQPAIQQRVIDAQHLDEELRMIGDRLATGAEHVILNSGPMVEFGLETGWWYRKIQNIEMIF